MNGIFLFLTAAIIAGYAVALWRLLRHESPSSLLIVAALSAVALLLRLVEWSKYPGGLNSDEPMILVRAMASLGRGHLFRQGPSGLPELIPVLFQAQLVPLIGGGRWAIRLYSLLGSVLSVAATFAVARAMRMRPVSSLAAAAFVTFLPWSLFYGRISQGGELLFNQLLLLAALARLIWRDGTWREIPAGALGLCLLFYDYFSGRSMLAMPFVAAVLARGRRRLWCLLIVIVGLAGFVPFAIQGNSYAFVGLNMQQVNPAYSTDPVNFLWMKVARTFGALAYPLSSNGWMTVSHGAVHPWLILILAVLGLLTGFRRSLFLVGGFCVGLMPSLVAHGDIVSSHRIHAAYVFIALAAGASFDLIPWRWLRAMVAAVVIAVTGFQSISLYFSDRFWNNEARWMFDSDATDVVESIPADEQRIFAVDLGYLIDMRTEIKPRVQPFNVENLFLDGPALYAFSANFWPLRVFYEPLLPADAIKTFGEAFTVRIGWWDTQWLRRYGWTYQATCGDIVRQTRIPTLFQNGYTFKDLNCKPPIEHLWKAKWLGPPSRLRLWHGLSEVKVTTSPGSDYFGTKNGESVDFDVQTGAEITVRIVGGQNVLATLYTMMPQSERLPFWEWVEPIPPS